MDDDQRRIPKFYNLSVEERVRAVHERGIVTLDDFRSLATGKHTLDLEAADKMVENVVGVMGLPLGLGMNLVVNKKRYVVPMAVEEPSVIAALGSGSKLISEHGGGRGRFYRSNNDWTDSGGGSTRYRYCKDFSNGE